VIGDARCQSNSLYGRGSGVALANAAALADVLTEHPRDSETQALAFEASVGAEIAGRHELSLARDRALRRSYQGEPAWDDPGRGDGFIESTVRAAAAHDPEIFRAVTRRDLQLDPVDGAEPGSRLWDLACAAHGFVPLSPGGDPSADAPRLRALVDGYDLTKHQRRELPSLIEAHTRGMDSLLRTSAAHRRTTLGAAVRGRSRR
jgi:hypothetical protein